MTTFWFALCWLGPINPPTHTYPTPARCEYVTRADCEDLHDDCFLGWVETPKMRR